MSRLANLSLPRAPTPDASKHLPCRRALGELATGAPGESAAGAHPTPADLKHFLSRQSISKRPLWISPLDNYCLEQFGTAHLKLPQRGYDVLPRLHTKANPTADSMSKNGVTLTNTHSNAWSIVAAIAVSGSLKSHV